MRDMEEEVLSMRLKVGDRIRIADKSYGVYGSWFPEGSLATVIAIDSVLGGNGCTAINMVTVKNDTGEIALILDKRLEKV